MNSEFALIVAALSLCLSIYLGLRKAPHEAKSLDGLATEAFERAATSVAARNVELVNFIAKLEAEVEGKDRDNTELKRLLEEEKIRSQKYQNWAERLVYQVKMTGIGEPVPFEQYPPQADTIKKPS